MDLTQALREGRDEATPDEAAALLGAARRRVVRRRRTGVAAVAVVALGLAGGGTFALDGRSPQATRLQLAQQPEPTPVATPSDLFVRHTVVVTTEPAVTASPTLTTVTWTNLRTGAAVVTTTLAPGDGTPATTTVGVEPSGRTASAAATEAFGIQDVRQEQARHLGPLDPAGARDLLAHQPLVEAAEGADPRGNGSPDGCRHWTTTELAMTSAGGSLFTDLCLDPVTQQPRRTVVDAAFPSDSSLTITDVELVPGTPENLARTTSASPAPAPASTSTSAVPASASPTALPASEAAPPPSPSPSTGPVPVCLTGDVTVEVTPRDEPVGAQPYADHEGTVLVTSRGSRTCSVAGTPGVVLLGDDGKPVEEKVENRTTQQYGQPPQTVVLAPGGVASFAFRRPDGTPGDGVECTHVADALVSMPGSTDSQPSGISFTGCDTGHGLPIAVGDLVAGPDARLPG